MDSLLNSSSILTFWEHPRYFSINLFETHGIWFQKVSAFHELLIFLLAPTVLPENQGSFPLKCHLLGHVPEKAMAPHSSTLAWKISRPEEPGRLQSMGSPRVGHD